ncbi:MAG: hypothetical protein H5U40_11675, partial [Polyangiaceae bacterium]|nr:hypothetical protein [Polyangiaceae bacterium]
MKRLIAVLFAIWGGCAPATSRELVEVTLAVEGASAGSFSADGFDVVLERAEVVVGPLYFCATEHPEFDFCDAALFEQLDPFVIDALAAEPIEIGVLVGTT